MTIEETAGTSIGVPGPHGDVELRVHRPDGTPDAALVWVHGGAFVAGDLDMPESDAVARALAATGVLVVAVGYRLAGPGTHYPVPSDDVLAAWRWGSAHARALGVDPSRIQLGGASAGGNLVAGAVLRLVAAGEPVPAAVVLAYPTLHAVPPTASAAATAALERLPERERWPALAVEAMYRAYLGGDPSAAPAAAVTGTADLTGFPPTFAVTSEVDGLRGSAEDFVRRLVDQGTPVFSVCERETEHGHLNRPGPEFSASVGRMASWLRHAPDLAG